MRVFSEILKEQDLKEFLESASGTLYFNPGAYERHVAPIIVRKFDGVLPPSLAVCYADLIRAAQEWIEQRPELSQLVRIEQPVEVGQDFVARGHHSYFDPTRYYGEDDSLEIPPELEAIGHCFLRVSRQVHRECDRLIVSVLARSILEPSGKTFFEWTEGKFIIVDLKPSRSELECWSHLKSVSSD